MIGLLSCVLMIASLQTETLQCPKWVPGTNEVLPEGITLSPEQELVNRVRCYCEVIKPLESQCIQQGYPQEACRQKTTLWISRNLSLATLNMLTPVPRRARMINVEP